MLKLQTDIATAVAGALKVTLLTDPAARIEVGGTRNPAALDGYLRTTKTWRLDYGSSRGFLAAIDGFTEVIRLDPNYALAFAARSFAYSRYAGEFATGPAIRDNFAKALADARRAIELAPELADGYGSLGFYFATGALDFRQASDAYRRARELAPGNVRVLTASGEFAAVVGRFDEGLADLRRAATLDPLNPLSHLVLGDGLYRARRYEEAAAAFSEAVNLDPAFLRAYAYRGLAYYGLGTFAAARASCETRRDVWAAHWCLAVTYEKLGRHADAEAEVVKIKAAVGDSAAYQYSTIYAQWGDTQRALEWLDTAMRLRDAGLSYLKTDPLMDPLRKEPRFQAVMRELAFPD